MRRPLAAFVPASAALLLAIPVAAAQPGVAPGAVQVDAVPAYAGPGAAVPTAPPAPPPPPAAYVIAPRSSELVGIDRRAAEDPAADRAYLARSAIVAPRGTVSFDVRAPIAPGAFGSINASLTDRIEVGVGAIVIADEGGLLGLHGKLQLVRGRRAALALSLDVFSKNDHDDYDDEDTMYLPSLVASFCTDGDACRTLLSLHLTGAAADGEDEMPVFGGVSFVTGGKNRLVGELHINRDDESGDTVFGGYLGGRFGGRKVAFDAGMAIGGYIESSDTCGDCGGDDDSDIQPFPFVGMSARL